MRRGYPHMHTVENDALDDGGEHCFVLNHEVNTFEVGSPDRSPNIPPPCF